MKKLSEEFFIGILVGLCGGILGDLFVTSLYRIIDKTPGGYNELTFVIALISLITVIWLSLRIWKNIKQN